MTEAEDYRIQDLDRYYGQDHAFDFPELFEELRDLRALYVGCGKAEALEILGPGSVGIDFNDALMPLWERAGRVCEIADARHLPQFRDDSFDLTFSVDFFEHVKPRDLDGVVEELRRVAPSGLHVIDTTAQSGYRGTGSKNLHPSGHLTAEDWRRILGPGTAVDRSRAGRHYIARW